MMDLIMDLLTAGDCIEREYTYQRLERLGVDRKTANIMAAEFMQGTEVKCND